MLRKKMWIAASALMALTSLSPGPVDAGQKFLAYEESITMAGDVFGKSWEETVGGRCPEGSVRGSYDTQHLRDGHCEGRGWASQDPQDCRAVFHMGIAGAYKGETSGTCIAQVYAIRSQ